jgi:kinesin family protein 4/21/27
MKHPCGLCSLSLLLCRAGIIRRAAEHILAHVDALRQKLKPGEDISVKAYGLELYNEELRDLSSHSAAAAAAAAGMEDSSSSSSVRISERPCGNGRCIPEVRP